MTIDIGKSARFGGALGVITYLLSWIVGFLIKNGGQPQASLNFIPTLTEGVKNNIVSGFDTSFASKLLGWISGISPFNFMGLITVAIAGVILAIVGAFIVDAVKNNAFGKFINKTELRQIVGITLLGSLVISLAISLFAGSVQLPAIWATVTMAIYFIIVAYVYIGLQTIFPQLKKNLLISP